MNLKRLRELRDSFIAEYPATSATVKNFFAYVKEMEKERKTAEFKPDPTPMIGLNPFKKTEVVDGDHLYIPPADKKVNPRIDAEFNKLLNYRVGEYEGVGE